MSTKTQETRRYYSTVTSSGGHEPSMGTTMIPVVIDKEPWNQDDGTLTHEVVTREDGTKVFQVTINAKDYKPEDITVKVTNGQLDISGKHEEKSESGAFSSKSFSQSCTIPRGVQENDLNCSLDTSGRLLISAPMKSQESLTSTTTIPILMSSNSPNYKVTPIEGPAQTITVSYPTTSSEKVTTTKTVRTFKTVS